MDTSKSITLSALLMPCLLMASETNLQNNDNALISHIKSTDYIFTTALGICSSEHVSHKGKNFIYTAVCAANAAKESDCPEYQVKAEGTIDSKTWATIRKLTFELKCYG